MYKKTGGNTTCFLLLCFNQQVFNGNIFKIPLKAIIDGTSRSVIYTGRLSAKLETRPRSTFNS